MNKLEISQTLMAVFDKIANAADQEEVEAILKSFDPELLKEYQKIILRNSTQLRSGSAVEVAFLKNVEAVETHFTENKKRNQLASQPYLQLIKRINARYDIDLFEKDKVELIEDKNLSKVGLVLHTLAPSVYQTLKVLLSEIKNMKSEKDFGSNLDELEVEYKDEKFLIATSMDVDQLEGFVRYLHTI